MPYFLKLLSVFLLASVKYFYTPIFAYLAGLNFIETSITMISGGITSFLVFYHLSYFVVISTKYVKPAAKSMTPEIWLKKYYDRKERKAKESKPKKKFNRRNRFIIKLRKIGVWAIILTIPIVISIPLGAFLLRKYYSHKSGVIFFALLAIAVEGFIFCVLVWNTPEIRP